MSCPRLRQASSLWNKPSNKVERRTRRDMPLHGVFSGRRGDVRLTCETVLHFPEDKEVRDPAHARLAKKIAARKALKEQSAVVSVASPGKGEHVLWPLYQFALQVNAKYWTCVCGCVQRARRLVGRTSCVFAILLSMYAAPAGSTIKIGRLARSDGQLPIGALTITRILMIIGPTVNNRNNRL
jgi:hypothetical protein